MAAGGRNREGLPDARWYGLAPQQHGQTLDAPAHEERNLGAPLEDRNCCVGPEAACLRGSILRPWCRLVHLGFDLVNRYGSEGRIVGLGGDWELD